MRYVTDRKKQQRFGFTLIELLVVISIIALLIALLLPALGMARANGFRAQALSQIRGIGIGLHMYVNDYSGWFPVNSPVTAPDNPSGLQVAGVNIYGMIVPFVVGGYANQKYAPVGLGQLASPGLLASGSNASPNAVFGNYMPAEQLASPQDLAFRRNRKASNGIATDPYLYFGYKGAVFDGASLPLDPGGFWWSSAGYGPYYFSSSYSYRAGHIGDWSGLRGVDTGFGTGAIFNAQWPYLNTSPNNLRSDAIEANARCIVAENGGRHAQLGGGCYLLRDGSGHWFPNTYYASGMFNRNNNSSQPLYNTYAGIWPEQHHGIFPMLLHAAIDRYRQSLPVPGSN